MSPHRPRTVVCHDYFAIRGGGERLAITLAHALDATLVFGFRNAETYDLDLFPLDRVDLRLPSLLQTQQIRVGALALRFASARRVIRNYDLRIFAGTAAPLAAPRKGDGFNVYYCHTPPRFLYDQKHHFSVSGRASILRGIALETYRKAYLNAVDRMDVVIANSRTVQARIREYLGRDSEVVYPPCDTSRFVWRGQGDYYLSTARLGALKRVDRIVDAFREMPDRTLVVASGGEQIDALRKRAEGYANIHILGWVSEERLNDLMGNAIATIYVPVNEDFGMSPVESMSAGKPVIGVAEGGLRETIVPGETGILLDPDPSAVDIAAAVRTLTPERAMAMRSACEQRAQLFSETVFIDRMREVTGHGP
ncbi:hypothetical protein LA66_11615 [Aureimonas altamirensis]|uniref:GDP-Man:Man(1)GlcNAc(2)-PP-Dol alpha-1,3-mannosyltransferase n=1 Tax=Aureimonas altamirensis TaxID=370622 RepID=A0A0B1Q5E1_9HYPH|nr:glycosyltransferase [Aureimonas altamirensis]KHJ54117.1 hypothetical protein LA66_11615 [Aureimonas altamirensis]